MWSLVKDSIFIKHDIYVDHHYFYITNFTYLWEQVSSQDELLSIIKKCNPLLEGDTSSLIESCLGKLFDSLLKNMVESQVDYDDETRKEIILLNLKTLDGKFPVRLSLRCSLASSSKFYEHITSNLLNIIKELNENKVFLMELLMKKDFEIQEYKAEGATLPFKHHETRPFVQHEYESAHSNLLRSFINCETYFLKNEIKEESEENSIKKGNIGVANNIPTSSPSTENQINTMIHSNYGFLSSTAMSNDPVEDLEQKHTKKRKKTFV